MINDRNVVPTEELVRMQTTLRDESIPPQERFYRSVVFLTDCLVSQELVDRAAAEQRSGRRQQ